MSNKISSMDQGMLGKIGEKINGTGGTSKVKQDPAGASKDVANKPGSGDTVELTSSAKLLERLEKTLSSLPEIDRARVEAVKTSIANGEYEIDADKIVDAILRADQEYGGQ